MTLDHHCREMPWAAVLNKAREMGYLSRQARTCGYYIHTNRNSFGDTEAQQDACIARILHFFEKNRNELLKFSCCTQRQLEQRAARYGYKKQPIEILERAKKGGHGGRYSCVNLQNAGTIEFRMFCGILKLKPRCNSLTESAMWQFYVRRGSEGSALDYLRLGLYPAGIGSSSA